MQIKDKSTVAFLFLLKPLKQGPLEDPATRENNRLVVTENNFQVQLYSKRELLFLNTFV